jgi:hypothetical protein
MEVNVLVHSCHALLVILYNNKLIRRYQVGGELVHSVDIHLIFLLVLHILPDLMRKVFP